MAKVFSSGGVTGKTVGKQKNNNADDGGGVWLQHPLYIVLVFPWLVGL